MILDVKITGSGTPANVIQSLEAAIKALKASTKAHEDLGGGIYHVYLEDATLCSVISEQ